MARLLILIAAFMLAGHASAQTTSNCTREQIVAGIAAVPEWSNVTQLIAGLNATALLPNESGPGTIFLPVNSAFEASVPVATLLAQYPAQALSILAYHSLLAQGKNYNRGSLRSASPIQTDLGVFETSIQGNNVSLPLIISSPLALSRGITGGKERARGVGSTSAIRGLQRICGMYMYPVETVLLPTATPQSAPTNLLSALKALPANASAPAGLGAAVAAGNVTLTATNGTTIASALPPADTAAEGPAGAPASGPGASMASGPGGSAAAPASAPGASGAPGAAGAAVVAAIAGQALFLNGTGGTLTSTAPVFLAGTVTPAANASSSANATAPLGPGLIFLNGTVADGKGVNGTATLVRSLTGRGAQLTRTSIPLTGATVNGTAFAAGGISVTGTPSTATNSTGFGAALPTAAGGALTSTGQVLFNGNVTGGTALNASAATGTAAQGALGPGPILVNGTVTNGTGVSGTAYPVVAISSTGIRVNMDNGLNITGAKFSGSAFNGTTTLPVVLQASTAAGGAGAASTGSSGIAGGPTSSSSAPAPAPATAPAPAPQSAPAAATAGSLVLAAAAAVALLMA